MIDSLTETLRKRLSRAARFCSVPLLAGLAVTGLVLGVKQLGWLQQRELDAYDQATRLMPAEPIDPRILVVLITTKDIGKHGVPVPDPIVNQALQKLIEGSAAVIGVDLIKDVTKDDLLKTFKADNQVIAICSHGGKSEETIKSPPGMDSEDFLGKVGFADLPVDPDGVVRRASLLIGGTDPTSGCLAQYSLAENMANHYLEDIHKKQSGLDEASRLYKIGGRAIPNLATNFGGYQQAETAGYPIMLKYRRSEQDFETVTLSDILDDKVKNIQDRIVLVGADYKIGGGDKDSIRTPFSPNGAEDQKMLGVRIHAQVTSQLISAVLDNRPLIRAWSEPTEGLWLFGWSLVGGSLAWFVRHPGKLLGSLTLAGTGSIGAFGLLFANSVWIPVLSPLLGLGGAALAAYGWRNYGIDREQQKMQSLARNQEQTIEALKQILSQQPITGIPTQNLPPPMPATTAIPEQRLLGDRYQTINILGAGGFATTYLAEDNNKPSKPRCAIKHLTPARRDAAFVDMARRLFNTEAAILERLGNHGQIPNLLAYFEQNGEFYLVQELIEGKCLDQELDDTAEPWTEKKVVDLLQQMLPVLEYIHERGVIHRDIKPSNIIRRSKDNMFVLIDFGAVKEINPQMPDVNTIAIGTRGYTPAEQYAGFPRFASDVYALGTIAIEVATNINPRDIPQNEKTGGLDWEDLAPLSPELKAIINKMVAYQYQQRYQRAADVLPDLQAMLHAKTTDSQPLSK
jgi:CHASE2 domain-containing sensor protein/predicted Ser/Thr protein kinase